MKKVFLVMLTLGILSITLMSCYTHHKCPAYSKTVDIEAQADKV